MLWSNLPPRTTRRKAENAGIDDYDVSIYNNALPDIVVGSEALYCYTARPSVCKLNIYKTLLS